MTPATRPKVEDASEAEPRDVGRSDELAASVDPTRPDRAWWAAHGLEALALPVILFVILRPERYGLEPNSLDPFFYTGYAINFDDILRETGGGHYSASRWSVYLPSRVMSDLLGPSTGRLVLRWVVASTILLALWHLGRRWRWTPWTEFLIGLVVLTSPVFGRAFMTDYVEWVFVAAGIVLVCLCLGVHATLPRSAGIGILAAMIVIANPLAVTITLAPIAVYLLAATLRRDRSPGLHAAVIVAASLCTAAFGWLLFRLNYGIGNVYQPTIEFLTTRSNQPDLLKSPRLTWMTSFTWIYLPAILGISAVAIPAVRRMLTPRSAALAAFGLLGIQYVFQWADQFLRDGNGLEVSYYWSFIVPTLTVATAVFIGSVQWNRRTAPVLVGMWLLLLGAPHVLEFRLPGGVAFAALVVLTVGTAAILAQRGRDTYSALAVGAVVLLMLAAQTLSPRYDPSAYHPFNMDPAYGSVFFSAGSSSDRDLEEAIWLNDQLDRIPSDAGAVFVVQQTGWQVETESAALVVGIFGAHLTGRLVPTADADRLAVQPPPAIASLSAPTLVVYGTSEFVTDAVAAIGEHVETEVVLDAVNGGAHGFRLVVLDPLDPADERVSWPAAILPSQTGIVESTTRRTRTGIDPAGFVTFGPYVQLRDDRYRATLSYRSPGPVDEVVGFFDVHLAPETVAGVELTGTNLSLREVSLEFDGSSTTRWEFRSFWSGQSPIVIEKVTVEPLGR